MPDADGCAAKDGSVLKYHSKCDLPEAEFEFNPETGELWHVCSNKRVCVQNFVQGEYVRIDSRCPTPVNRNKWIITFCKLLYM